LLPVSANGQIRGIFSLGLILVNYFFWPQGHHHVRRCSFLPPPHEHSVSSLAHISSLCAMLCRTSSPFLLIPSPSRRKP
jgi:hypothetical protein